MTDVARFYHDVIDDVINGVKDEWVEEGLDLQVLDELKKLWTTKLAETHVFDPEPAVNTAAQYLNLLQRSQVQVRPTGTANMNNSNLSVRHVAPAGRVVMPNLGPAGGNLPGSLTNIRPSVVALSSSQLSQAPAGAQQQQQRLPQHHALFHGNLVAGGTSTNTAPLQARCLVPGGAPQLAALPSGLTGHLVQIGQQTYLVPQTIVGLRQPLGSSQLPLPHLVGTTTTAAATTTGGQCMDPSAFQQTQVDGNHDNIDKFCDTPGSRRPTSNSTAPNSSAQPGTGRSEFEEEDDDDDDDDDFVAATPGFTPSSVPPHYQAHHRESTAPDSSSHHPDPQSLMSAPQTPMTPSSVLSRVSFVETPGWRRPSVPVRHPGATPSGRKRRRRSAPGDTDTDDYFDDDDDEEDAYGVGEEAEVATNASMTPAGPGAEPEDEDDGDIVDVTSTRSPRPRLLRGVKSARPVAKAAMQSPAPSQLGDAPPDFHEPSAGGGDLETPRGDDDEEPEAEEEEPLNSEDDVSDEEPEVLFESDNVVVCQYDKIHRSRNRWRFHLKDGIMAIHGRDHVFQKALGEAEW